MKKIEIFVGSDSAFEKIVPKSARNLSEMAAKLDDGNKKMDVFSVIFSIISFIILLLPVASIYVL